MTTLSIRWSKGCTATASSLHRYVRGSRPDAIFVYLVLRDEVWLIDMGLHYDPLLCAQDVPAFVVPDQAFIAGETALVTARTSFQNQILLLDLRLEGDDGWLISKITCVHGTERTVRAFYAWYLGYIGDRGDGSFRNPLADRAYRWQPLLSPAFVQQVDEMGDEEHGFGHDPFLAAQAEVAVPVLQSLLNSLVFEE